MGARKIADRFLAPVELRDDDAFVRGEMLRRLRLDLPDLVIEQDAIRLRDAARHQARDLALPVEDLRGGQRAVGPHRPDIAAGPGLDQRDDGAESFVRGVDPAGDDVVDAERLDEIRGRMAAVVIGGLRAIDQDVLEPRQVGDDRRPSGRRRGSSPDASASLSNGRTKIAGRRSGVPALLRRRGSPSRQLRPRDDDGGNQHGDHNRSDRRRPGRSSPIPAPAVARRLWRRPPATPHPPARTPEYRSPWGWRSGSDSSLPAVR